jgi:hypothetical protein
MRSTQEMIEPIIYKTYGKSIYAESLVRYLAEQIVTDKWDSRGREHKVMLVCWDWMTGGSTAASVAAKIEAALSEVKS